ncbi:protein spindle-F isoform X2 [Phlebotomus papatasi]|uniref:protein spindle-F isoform X2 n=1 Tax=Phlebotomus papatasi TaxID=29031 RepID=UPI00248346A7|nr:protein spindle-F isoform X2 [Phlebotomus papatasi]
MAGSDEANYALHIALTTLRERCQKLEARLSAVEEENHQLRLKLGDRQNLDLGESAESEVGALQAKVSDLTRQKVQLTDHIAMVATENRQLWSRLSRLTKDSRPPKASPPSPITSQNLIRSKTFTQNAPNPKLRDKLPDSENLSLEEISLQMLNEVTDAKQQLEKSCQEIMTASTADGETLMGFGFLADDSQEAEGDVTEKLTKGLDKYKKLKATMMKQQSDLRSLLEEKNSRRKLKVCRACEERAEIAKPMTVSIDSQTDFEEQCRSVTPPIPEPPCPPTVPPQPRPRHIEPNRIDFLEQKRLADVLDKMCPMCGKIYSTTSKFEEFQEHVESHFVDENEMDLSLERNYEIVSNF